MNQLEDKITQKFEDNKDIFLAHMEEKYEKTFLPVSYTSEGVVVDEEFRCYVEGTDKERDVISVIRQEENGEEVIYDDYFGILIRDEYENRVQNLCSEVVDEAKVYINQFEVSYFSNELTKEHTIDDAVAMGQSISAFKYIFFEVVPGEEEAFYNACEYMCNVMKEKRFTGSVNFLGLAKGELQNINVDNYLTYIPNLIKPDGEICLMMSNHFVK